MSSPGMLPLCCSHRKIGGTAQADVVDHRGRAMRKHARQVVRDAAAGDVRHPLDAPAVEQRTDERQVRAMRLEQRVANGPRQLGHVAVHREPQMLEDDAPRQRVAVRMESRRRNADEHVANGDRASRDQPMPIDDADDEAGDVVFAFAVEAGHLRRLAAEQRAAVLTARSGDAADDRLRNRGRQSAGRQVVEEEQRLGALHQDVVDAVVDEVAADRVVATAPGTRPSASCRRRRRSRRAPARDTAPARAGTGRRRNRCRRERRW